MTDTVAFQGIHGAYSEQALRQFFSNSVEVRPCETLQDLFAVIQSRQVKYAIMPIENALVVFGGEVDVDGGGAVLGAGSDAADGDIRVAMRHEELQGGVEDGAPVGVAVLLLSG